MTPTVSPHQRSDEDTKRLNPLPLPPPLSFPPGFTHRRQIGYTVQNRDGSLQNILVDLSRFRRPGGWDMRGDNRGKFHLADPVGVIDDYVRI